MSVKRFYWDTPSEYGHAEEHPEGELVWWTDYAKLEADYAALLAATQWRPIETATWDVISKNDRVVLNGWNGSVRFAYVVDFEGKVDFENEYGVPLMAEYDGFTHWMPLPKPPGV